jgi:hypothetical protein
MPQEITSGTGPAAPRPRRAASLERVACRGANLPRGERLVERGLAHLPPHGQLAGVEALREQGADALELRRSRPPDAGRGDEARSARRAAAEPEEPPFAVAGTR